MRKMAMTCVALCTSTALCLAQAPPLTLESAVQQAVARYPAVQVSLEQVSAAAAAVDLARTRYLPRADFIAQLNRATHNNVFGMLLTQPVISPISGPVLGTNSLESVWGSAVGVQVSWEPFDFGRRKAEVAEAEAGRERASAQVPLTRLQVASGAADAYLTALAAEQTVLAARGAVDRARVLQDIVSALTSNELRPGADLSRAQAESALATNQLIRAEQSAALARASLGQFLGVDLTHTELLSEPLLRLPVEQMASFDPVQHPMAVAQRAAVDEARARERSLELAYLPRFSLQGTSYARGTGIQPDGSTGGAAAGLGPNIQNWGVGFSVYFPALDFASTKARRQIEFFSERRESARYDQVVRDLNSQMEKARIALSGARRIAQNTPSELEAARTGAQQASARYKSGLGSIAEVAEAQRILTQAEADDAIARLGVWRALLGVAVAAGDLMPFLQQAR
jgi:outer membrane protein